MASLVFANHLTRASCVWRPQVKAPAFAPITLGVPTGGGGRITPLDLSISSHRMTRCTANAKLCGEEQLRWSGLSSKRRVHPKRLEISCLPLWVRRFSCCHYGRRPLCWTLGYAAKSRIIVLRPIKGSDNQDTYPRQSDRRNDLFSRLHIVSPTKISYRRRIHVR